MLKILITRKMNGQDYLSDCILHGLRALDDVEVTDAPRSWYMYKKEFEPGRHNKKNLYGRGFTIFGTLDDDSYIDRSDIERKIVEKYYDLVICTRLDPSQLTPYANLIFQNYPANKVILLDGEDSKHIHRQYLNKGIYFKRELFENDSNLFPIGFGFPEEKIQLLREKTQTFATVIPGNSKTYIYDQEEDYYTDYSRSYFGITHKKGGWDCLRHYEIIGSRSVPYFKDIKSCPPRICTHLPKKELIEVVDIIEKNGVDWFTTGSGIDRYTELQNKIFEHFLQNCTTKSVANNLLKTYSKI